MVRDIFEDLTPGIPRRVPIWGQGLEAGFWLRLPHRSRSSVIALGSRWFPRRGVKRGCNDPPEPQDAEEPLPAGIAPVCGKTHEALQSDHRPFLDALARNMLQIKIPASGAMRVPHELQGNTRAMKPVIAGVATPRFQTEKSKDEVDRSASMRTKAIRAAALRTDHLPRSPVSPVRESIQFERSKQHSVLIPIWMIPRFPGVE